MARALIHVHLHTPDPGSNTAQVSVVKSWWRPQSRGGSITNELFRDRIEISGVGEMARVADALRTLADRLEMLA